MPAPPQVNAVLSFSLHEEPNRPWAQLAKHPFFRGTGDRGSHIVRDRVTSWQIARVADFSTHETNHSYFVGRRMLCEPQLRVSLPPKPPFTTVEKRPRERWLSATKPREGPPLRLPPLQRGARVG